MAAQKPLLFTAVSYIVNKSENGSVCCRKKIIFKKETKQDICKFIPIKTENYMSISDQQKCDKKMMSNASTAVSGLV